MDSFKLVRPCAVAGGHRRRRAAAALVCVAPRLAAAATGLFAGTFTRYMAPLTEETLKARFLVMLIARRRDRLPGRCRGAGIRRRHGLRAGRERHAICPRSATRR